MPVTRRVAFPPVWPRWTALSIVRRAPGIPHEGSGYAEDIESADIEVPSHPKHSCQAARLPNAPQPLGRGQHLSHSLFVSIGPDMVIDLSSMAARVSGPNGIPRREKGDSGGEAARAHPLCPGRRLGPRD